MRTVLRLVVFSSMLGLVWLASCGHSLRDGFYGLVTTEPAQVDTCGLLQASGGELPRGELSIKGDEVRFDLELLGPEDPVELVGRFRRAVSGEPDGFTVDGSLGNVRIPLNGTTCLISFGQIHLDATVPKGEDDAFYGTLTVSESLQANQHPSCPLSCNLVVGYRAERQ